MRTTVDLEQDLLAAAKERAAARRTTLSRVVSDAIKAYLENSKAETSEPFELITAGRPGGRYPNPEQMGELLTAEDAVPYTGE